MEHGGDTNSSADASVDPLLLSFTSYLGVFSQNHPNVSYERCDTCQTLIVVCLSVTVSFFVNSFP